MLPIDMNIYIHIYDAWRTEKIYGNERHIYMHAHVCIYMQNASAVHSPDAGSLVRYKEYPVSFS